MKQRLLLALLVLFAAAGMVKADPTLKVTLPANSGNVKLMVKGTISSEQSDEIKNQGGSLSGNTITLPTTNGGKEYDLSSVPSITWSELTVEGIVSAFELKGIDAVTSLTFTKNGQLGSLTLDATGLKTLKCNNALSSTLANLDLASCTNMETVDCSNNSLTSLTLTNLTKLKTLTCSNNALTTITLPSITGSNKCTVTCDGNQIKNVITSDATHFSVNYGYQYIEVTPSPDVIANQPVNIKDLASSSGLWGISDASTFKNNSDITCGSLWQNQNDKKEWSSTSEAKKNNANTYPNDYIFHNGTLYTKGTYRYSVEKANTPIKFYVQIPVKAAQIPVKFVAANKINGVVTGSITIENTSVTETSTVTLEAGKATDIKAVIDATLKDKVEFDKYELSPGVSISNGKVTASGLVSAKEVSIQPIFKPKKFKITYAGPSSTVGGTYLVTANGSPINPGTQVDYGTTLAITTTINDGYKVTVTKDGGTDVTLESGKATMTVTDDINLAISIIQETSETSFTVATNLTKLETGASVMTIGGKTVTVSDGSISDKFTPNSTIRISITPQSNYAVKQITVANTSYTPTLKSGAYIADIVVPAMASAPIHIMFTELETITEVKAKPNVTYTYNGSPQTFQYVTTPAGLSMTKVEYSKDDGSTWSTTAPTDVLYENGGTTIKPYKVKLTRNADANYASYITQNPYLNMEIKPAAASITTVPTVEVVNNNGVQSYSIKNGKANTAGVFHVTKAGSTSITDKKDIVLDVLKNKSHIVTVSFFAMNGDKENKNYDCLKATVEIPVKGLNADALPTFQVSTVAASNLPEHITSLKIYNGNVELKTPATVAKGTTLTFVATVEDGVTEAEIKETAAGATAINSTNKTPVNKKVSATQVVTNKMEITAIATAYTAPTPKSDFKSVTAAAQTTTYTGSVLKYKPETDGITAKDKDDATINSNLIYSVSYKDANGKDIVLPVDAGIYTVSIKVSHDDYNSKTVTTTFEVQKATPKVTWPKATQIAKKQTLQQSTFIESSSDVPGTFEWKDPTTEPTNGSLHDVVFIPADTKNYEKVTTPADKKVKVTVSDKMLITYGNIVNGTIKIKDAEGYEYLSGTEISKGKVLTITATPNESFELETLTLNGNAITNGSTYTVKDESIAISATFVLKKPNPAHVVITLPENGKGYKLSANGAKSVAFNANYTFTVSTLAADKDKVVVKAGGETIKASDNGSYTVKGDKDKGIVVTLSNPTKIKVSVEQTTKNAKGFTMGKVEVEGLASDSTCFYNDVITLVAYPESGVTLTGWSDATSNKDKLRTISVTSAMSIKPKFTGVPTGIETIEDTRVYGREGHIFIGCNGEAKVTLISMDGRVKKVEISGDSRIETAAGVYGVIVEKGSEVLKEKVIVK